MYVYTKLVLNFTGQVVEQEGYEYAGPVAECKGATTEQKDQAAADAALARKQASFYDVMTKSYDQMFAGQNHILAALQKAFEPILAAGPGQYGLTQAEDVALRTQASEGTAASYKMAKQAVAEGQAANSGDAFIPKGSDAEIKAELASKGAAQEASQQLGITQAGYDIGRQQFGQAASALGGVAGQMNPIGYSGASTGAGSSASQGGQDAFGQFTNIYQENKADSPWTVVGGLLGGALSTGLNAFSGGLGGNIPRRPMDERPSGSGWGNTTGHVE